MSEVETGEWIGWLDGALSVGLLRGVISCGRIGNLGAGSLRYDRAM